MRVNDKKKFTRFLILLMAFIFTISCGIKRITARDLTQKPIEIKTIEKKSTPLNSTELTTPVKKVEEKQKQYKFIKNYGLYVYKTMFQKTKIDTLKKGTRIEILEIKTIEKTENKKKTIFKIKYTKNLKTKVGWISKVALANSLNEILPVSWKKLDFKTNYKKNNFENNPKIKAKGIYLNIYTMSSRKKLQKLIELTKKTQINAFVLDVKDDSGYLSFEMEAPKMFGIPVPKRYAIKDIKKFMSILKENNIYTIARIVTFKDPTYAKANPDKVITSRKTGKPYTNKDGIIWVSAHDRNLWEYNLAIAEEAAKVGFNEIQFDYVRFPASNGGRLDKQLDYKNIQNESKPETIQKYLKYARDRLSKLNVYVSADLYGQVGTFNDDMGLGQYWEAISKVVDYVSPMMYPSHYAKGSYGILVPDAKPYKTIYYCLRDAINRNANIDNPAEIRPWIQAFTAKWVKGHINYTSKQIEEQIKAMKDLGVDEYLLWSPTNNYKIKGEAIGRNSNNR